MRRDRASMGMGVDEDLTMEERRLRWRMVEAIRQERAKRRRAVTNRKLWVDGRGWRWDEVKQCWKEQRRRSLKWSRKERKEIVFLVESRARGTREVLVREMKAEADRNKNVRR